MAKHPNRDLGQEESTKRSTDFNENLLQTTNEDPSSATEVCLLAGACIF
jgi:hypothetical protein